MFTAFITVKVENQFKRLTYFQNETPSFLAFKAALLAGNPAAIAMNELLQEYQQKFFPKCLTVNIVHAFATRLKKPLKGSKSSLSESDFNIELLNILNSKGFKLEFDYFVRFVSELQNIRFQECFFPIEFSVSHNKIDFPENMTSFEKTNHIFNFFNFIEMYKFLQTIDRIQTLPEFYGKFADAKNAYYLKDIQAKLSNDIQAKITEFDAEINKTVKRLVELEKNKLLTIQTMEKNKTELMRHFAQQQKKYKDIFE